MNNAHWLFSIFFYQHKRNKRKKKLRAQSETKCRSEASRQKPKQQLTILNAKKPSLCDQLLSDTKTYAQKTRSHIYTHTHTCGTNDTLTSITHANRFKMNIVHWCMSQRSLTDVYYCYQYQDVVIDFNVSMCFCTICHNKILFCIRPNISVRIRKGFANTQTYTHTHV